jgi:transcriptional regulator with XRE-family HTH domain
VANPRLQKRFGRVIRARREQMGVSQEELAYQANVHRTYVSMLERGISNPTLSVIADLASALKTTITSLAREVER